jgi:hypothetical protein
LHYSLVINEVEPSAHYKASQFPSVPALHLPSEPIKVVHDVPSSVNVYDEHGDNVSTHPFPFVLHLV